MASITTNASARILRDYERLVKKIPVEELVVKDKRHLHGLQRLQELVQREPNAANLHLGGWLELENSRGILDQAIVGKVSEVTQYLPLQDFHFPSWADMPHGRHHEHLCNEVLTSLGAAALLVCKSKKLYFVAATWAPREEYFWYKDREPDHVVTFVLSELMFEEVTWQDSRIMERIENGEWGRYAEVARGVSLALRDTIDAANDQARRLNDIAKDIEFAHESVSQGH